MPLDAKLPENSCAFSASSRRFDLNGEANRVRKKQSSAIIAADV